MKAAISTDCTKSSKFSFVPVSKSIETLSPSITLMNTVGYTSSNLEAPNKGASPEPY